MNADLVEQMLKELLRFNRRQRQFYENKLLTIRKKKDSSDRSPEDDNVIPFDSAKKKRASHGI